MAPRTWCAGSDINADEQQGPEVLDEEVSLDVVDGDSSSVRPEMEVVETVVGEKSQERESHLGIGGLTVRAVGLSEVSRRDPGQILGNPGGFLDRGSA